MNRVAVDPLVYPTYGTPVFRAEGEVVALAYAPDGTLWTLEDPGILRRLSAAGLPLERYFLSETETVWAFSADAAIVASGGSDLLFWDTDGGELLGRQSQPAWVTALAFSRDRQFLASGHDDGTVQVWDVARRRLIIRFTASRTAIAHLAFRPDGQFLAIATEGRSIHLWEASARKAAAKLIGHTERIAGLAWHPNSKWLVSAGWDHAVRVWHPPRLEPLTTLTHDEPFATVAISPDGRHVVALDSAGTLLVWDDPPGTAAPRRYRPGTDELAVLAFAPDGTQVVAAGVDRRLQVHDLRTGAALAGHAPPGTPVTLALAGPQVLLANGGPPRRFDLASGTPVPWPGEEFDAQVIAASADGRVVLTGAASGQVRWWGPAASQLLTQANGPISALACAPVNGWVAVAQQNDGSVSIWEPLAAQPRRTLANAADGCGIEHLLFHPDGQRLVCAGVDFMATGGSLGRAVVWDLLTGAAVHTLAEAAGPLAFAPSGRHLLVGTRTDTVLIYDVDTGHAVRELTGHLERVTALAVSPDGQHLAVASDDGTVRVWDWATSTKLAVRAFDAVLVALRFTPDGRGLLAALDAGTAWYIQVAGLLGKD
jgi:WD40 repeat protein